MRVPAEVVEKEVAPPPRPRAEAQADGARPPRRPGNEGDRSAGDYRRADAVSRSLMVVAAVDPAQQQVEVRRHRRRDRDGRMRHARQFSAVARGEEVDDEPGQAVTDRARQKLQPALEYLEVALLGLDDVVEECV